MKARVTEPGFIVKMWPRSGLPVTHRRKASRARRQRNVARAPVLGMRQVHDPVHEVQVFAQDADDLGPAHARFFGDREDGG
ncbi:hypothetical protein D3C73_1279090 [compost metagenome]